MKHICILIFFACICLTGCDSNQVKIGQDDIAIQDVNIVNVENGEILYNMTVIISDDQISLIGKTDTVRFSGSDNIVDGSGKYLIPGLWDMHAHIIDYDWVLNLYTAMGITGLRSMHGGKRIDDVLKNRKDGVYHGFEFLYSSPITDGPGENWAGSRIASNPEEGRQLVREYFEQGFDFVKLYNFLDFDTYMAIADECNALKIPFAGHVPLAVSTEEAIKAGQKSIEHSLGLEHALQDYKSFYTKIKDQSLGIYATDFLNSYDSTLKDHVLNITKTQKTWFCPTLVNLKSAAFSFAHDTIFKADKRLQYIPQEEQEYWFGDPTAEGTPDYLGPLEEFSEAEIAFYKLQCSYLKPMLDNGSRFLAGTDTSNPNIYPGFSLHDELQLFVEAGFTPLEALQTATLNPAIYTEKIDKLGTVEKGKIANLLLLDENPLENIENTRSIAGQFRRGKFLGKKDMAKLLESIKN